MCRLCNDAGVPLVPVGSATGLEGGIVAVQGGVAMVRLLIILRLLLDIF